MYNIDTENLLSDIVDIQDVPANCLMLNSERMYRNALSRVRILDARIVAFDIELSEKDNCCCTKTQVMLSFSAKSELWDDDM